MKYSKMLCWLQKTDEERLKAFDLSNAPITFVNSPEECAALITPETFVLCSLQFAEDDIEKMQEFVRKFPNLLIHMFAIYDNELTLNGFSIGYEPNVDKKSYLTEEVLEILRKFTHSSE
jgi:hypothetical protein